MKKPFIYSQSLIHPVLGSRSFRTSCKMETSEWKADRVRQMSFLFFSPYALQSLQHNRTHIEMTVPD